MDLPDTQSPSRTAPTAGCIAIVVARYNATITNALEEGAVGAWLDAGGSEDNLLIVPAAGAYELVALSLAAVRSGRCQGVVALGCVIKGETSHDQHLAQAVIGGLTEITLSTGVPIGLGVLTVNSVEQARERAGLGVGETQNAGGEVLGNKGAEAMEALLETLGAMEQLSAGMTGVSGDAQDSPGLGLGGLVRIKPRPDKAVARTMGEHV